MSFMKNKLNLSVHKNHLLGWACLECPAVQPQALWRSPDSNAFIVASSCILSKDKMVGGCVPADLAQRLHLGPQHALLPTLDRCALRL